MDPGRELWSERPTAASHSEYRSVALPDSARQRAPLSLASKLDNLLTVAASLAEGRLQRARIGGIEPVFHRR